MIDSGKASKSAIEGVIRDISAYTEAVKRELSLLIGDIESLSDVWCDEKHKELLSAAHRMCADVDSGLDVLSHARSELIRKVGMM